MDRLNPADTMTRTFTIATLGCRVNQCESDAIRHCLERQGWQAVDEGAACDLCVINTCTVTHRASMQSRQLIRQAVRNHPGARIVVTGCYAQTEPEVLSAIDGVDWVIGHRDKHRIPDMVLSGKPSCSRGEPGRLELFAATVPPRGARTRPVLKIQDGCNAFCSYCIVPYARGRSRSLPLTEVQASLAELRDHGFREVVLSGIHLGCYGLDLTPPTDLAGLLALLDPSDTVERIRLSSIEPRELTVEIIDRVAISRRYCHHFHIPMQSGDDDTLRKMRRPYDSRFFREKVLYVHSRMPEAAIGADVLIGLPGENHQAFTHTLRVVEELPLTYLHVFPFSPREGTPAATWDGRVPPEVIKERCRRVREAGDRKRQAFYQRHIGTSVTLLVETRRDRRSGLLRGMTGNYIPVTFAGDDRWMNRFARVRIDSVQDGGVTGSLEASQ
jgi:threonylcarbamoyladenosine tRNA methylthiotransferase MtaB